jgi:ATP-dependent Clp protease protease subunit
MPAELWIYDVIGQDWFGEGVTAKKVRDMLAEIDSQERVLVRINSPGGLVFEAASIHTLLLQHKGGVDVQIDGLAASAASYIATVGEKVAIADGGMIMIHDPWSIVMGDSRDMRAEAELLDKMGGKLADAYAQRSGKGVEEVRTAMLAETWMTSDEAIDFGLADEKVESAAKACAIPSEFNYRNAPRQGALRVSQRLPKKAAAMARQMQETKTRIGLI